MNLQIEFDLNYVRVVLRSRKGEISEIVASLVERSPTEDKER